MLYWRTTKKLFIEQQRGREDKVKVEGYVDALKERFPGVGVAVGHGSLLRTKYTFTFGSIADAKSAEAFIDND